MSDVDRGLVVRGVGGSTGCPEYKGVSRDKLQAGQRMREEFQAGIRKKEKENPSIKSGE